MAAGIWPLLANASTDSLPLAFSLTLGTLRSFDKAIRGEQPMKQSLRQDPASSGPSLSHIQPAFFLVKPRGTIFPTF